MWLCFDAPDWHPVAVRVEVGGVCALTGAHEANALSADPQNYMVAPDQPFLDGIKSADGIIRQFVAAPLGDGVTIEGQVTGAESNGGIQITVVQPKPGRFPSERPHRAFVQNEAYSLNDAVYSAQAPMAMGLGAGGRMVQKIYPDEYGIDTSDASTTTTVNIHLVAAECWRELTGEEPPPSPVSVDAYIKHRLPWFKLFDEHLGDLPVQPALAKVIPIAFD